MHSTELRQSVAKILGCSAYHENWAVSYLLTVGFQRVTTTCRIQTSVGQQGNHTYLFLGGDFNLSSTSNVDITKGILVYAKFSLILVNKIIMIHTV